MGTVFAVYKVYPEDPEKLDAIVDAIKKVKAATLKDIKREPIGFGVELIKAGFTYPDKVPEIPGNLEQELSQIDGVNQVEADQVTLL